MHPQNPGAYLNQPEGIPALIPQAKRLLELRRALARLLPESLARSCSVANYKQGKIIIFAENSAVAAKLKLLRPTLCDQLSKRGVQVTVMEIEVQPRTEPVQENLPKAARMTDSAARSLTDFYNQLPDSELKTTLSRLAGNKISDR